MSDWWQHTKGFPLIYSSTMVALGTNWNLLVLSSDGVHMVMSTAVYQVPPETITLGRLNIESVFSINLGALPSTNPGIAGRVWSATGALLVSTGP
jgi:hypothetical protein